MNKKEKMLDMKLSKILKEAVEIMQKLRYATTNRDIGKNYVTIEYSPIPKKCSKCGNIIIEAA